MVMMPAQSGLCLWVCYYLMHTTVRVIGKNSLWILFENKESHHLQSIDGLDARCLVTQLTEEKLSAIKGERCSPSLKQQVPLDPGTTASFGFMLSVEPNAKCVKDTPPPFQLPRRSSTRTNHKTWSHYLKKKTKGNPFCHFECLEN